MLVSYNVDIAITQFIITLHVMIMVIFMLDIILAMALNTRPKLNLAFDISTIGIALVFILLLQFLLSLMNGTGSTEIPLYDHWAFSTQIEIITIVAVIQLMAMMTAHRWLSNKHQRYCAVPLPLSGQG